ncbi:hypothetical protein [Paenibacillus sp. FSL R10-2736]|uniref:hypothetical protein n=1 Tax=Paenibacillus sp. FSL R10-2736 TaxID=2954692 RepID=UPI0030F80B08
MIGIVSVGVSIFAENPAPFYLWIENLINRTVSSLLKSGENFPNAIINQAKELAANGIRQAISGNNPIEVFQNYDTVDFKAGAIKYSGRNLLLGQTVSPTFGLKPYVAFRWRASGIPVYYY